MRGYGRTTGAVRRNVVEDATPPVGGGTPPPVVNTDLVVRSDLPFNVPTDTVLRAGPKVFAHYFLTFPIVYTSNQNSVAGDDADSRWTGSTPNDTANYYYRWGPGGNVDQPIFGGVLRDRPAYERAPRASKTSPTLPGKTLDYRILDKITETYQALDGGLDGWTVDLLDIPKNAGEFNLTVSELNGGAPLRWRQTVELYEAAAEVNRREGAGTVTICVMPDGSTDGTMAPASLLSNALNWLDVNYPGVNYKIGGAFVVAPYQPEVAPSYDNSVAGASVVKVPDYWSDVLTGLQGKGHKTFFWPCYSRLWTAAAQHPLIAHLTQGISRWGSRDGTTARAENNQERTMYSYIKANWPGNKFMAPVAHGDTRPNQSNYFESNHTSALDETWKTAIGDGTTAHVKADAVQIPTWNDYAEGAQIGPSRNHGWCPLDLSMWHLIKYKTGANPVVVRDALYLSHRIQPTDDVATMTYTGGQTKLMTKRSGGTPNQNTVGVVAFLTAPADVVVNVGGREVTYAATPAGRTVLPHTALLPIGTGLISCRAVRSGATIASIAESTQFQVGTTKVVQDMQYRFRKSLPNRALVTT